MSLERYQSAVVTGASRGIGAAIVRRLCRSGLAVHAVARSAADLARRLKGMCGLSADVEIAAPGAVERSMGKARRVIDKRPK